MKERFSIWAIKDWLLRGRRISNVSPTTELEPPAVEPDLLNEANTPISVGPNGREKRRLRMDLYISERENGQNNASLEKKRKRAKNGQSQNGPQPVSQGPKESIRPERRELVVEDKKLRKQLESIQGGKALSIRELEKIGEKRGFSLERRNDGHGILTHPDGRKVVLPRSPEKSTVSKGVQTDALKIFLTPKSK